jgi:hypothetical protein
VLNAWNVTFVLQVVDAEDVLSVVQALVQQGVAHAGQVVIQGIPTLHGHHTQANACTCMVTTHKQTHVALPLMMTPHLFLQGGSAGGFTVLNALVSGSVFAAGASYYGVADMLSLASDTHDFESRYLDSLLGPLPQSRDTYIARSPLTHVGKMTAALILFQGSEDKVRPLLSRAFLS